MLKYIYLFIYTEKDISSPSDPFNCRVKSAFFDVRR